MWQITFVSRLDRGMIKSQETTRCNVLPTTDHKRTGIIAIYKNVRFLFIYWTALGFCQGQLVT